MVIPPDGGQQLRNAASLNIGPLAGRTSSPTQINHAGALSQSTLSAFYPDFLRRRATPARHEVVDGEVDKYLLTDTSTVGNTNRNQEAARISAGIRDFPKRKTENEDKEEI